MEHRSAATSNAKFLLELWKTFVTRKQNVSGFIQGILLLLHHVPAVLVQRVSFVW